MPRRFQETSLQRVLVLFTVIVALAASPALAAKRVALVIGNNNYTTLPNLNNAKKDAEGMASKLRGLGFDVILKTNAGSRTIGRALADFENRLAKADVALVFYAGHGIQANGKNHLIPSDANIEVEEDLRFESVDAQEFLQAMNRAGTPLNIVILDACRDNPLPRRSRSAARGLAIPAAPAGIKGTAIVYSAAPGQTAQDGPRGGHGVFTGALLKVLDEPGLKLEDVFKKTARLVAASTRGKQDPWINSSVKGDFYFKPGHVSTSSSASSADKETVFWQSIKDSDDVDNFLAYLEQYPKGSFAALARIKLKKLKRSRVASLTSSGSKEAGQVLKKSSKPSPSSSLSDKQHIKIKIAVTNFIASTSDVKKYVNDFATVISEDLERSSLFKPIDNSAFIQLAQARNTLPSFGNWRGLSARNLVQGHIQRVADGRLRIEFRLWDVFAEQQMVGLAYFTVPHNWRRVAHIIADAIYKRVTGKIGNFDSRIVYVSKTGPTDRKITRLAIMDQDGKNHTFLTNGNSLVATPRFSPNQQLITYQSHYRDVPRVYNFNIDTGRQEVAGDFSNVTSEPRFSPDGKKVILSMANDGNMDIYTVEMETDNVIRLTKGSDTNASPGYSPDGKNVVFSSTRSGNQQLFVMSADGGQIQKISRGEGTYSTPVYSPDGKLIAAVKKSGGKSHLVVMSSDGRGEKSLKTGGDDGTPSSPSWSPNSQAILYSRETGTRQKLYVYTLKSGYEYEVATPFNAIEGNWSKVIR
jgi:TolB protein